MVDRKNHPWIIDFGLSTLTTSAKKRIEDLDVLKEVPSEFLNSKLVEAWRAYANFVSEAT